MTEKKFDYVINKQLENCKNTLVIKGVEYRRNNNPLHNFDIGEQQSTTGESREDIIWGMARKHWISIQDIRQDVKNGKLPTNAQLDEKYGDFINYLLLEKASIVDKIDQKSHYNHFASTEFLNVDKNNKNE